MCSVSFIALVFLELPYNAFLFVPASELEILFDHFFYIYQL